MTTTTLSTPVPARVRRRWRAAWFVAMATAVAALMGGLAYAFLSVNGSGTGSASTSTVSIGTPVTTTCTYPNLVPGDLTGAATCSLGVTYTGSISAWMSLTVAIQSKAGTIVNAKPLYDGTNNTGLTLSISDGHHSFTVPTGPGTNVGCAAGYRCWTAANELAAWYSGSTANLSFANGNSVTWTVTPVFPKTVTNPYQGATATLSLTAQAVQTPANALPASACTTSTIGQPCAPSGTFTWS